MMGTVRTGRIAMVVSTLQCENAEPYIKATLDTFKTMVGLDVNRGEIKPRGSPEIFHDVSAIIALSGAAEGFVCLGFSEATATAVAGGFLGRKEPLPQALMVDTLAEIVNIITGYAGKDSKFGDIRISLPTIVTGHNHAINTRCNELQTVTEFESPAGSFHLYVFIEHAAQLEQRMPPVPKE
jgi:chemotaxis protein CheX